MATDFDSMHAVSALNTDIPPSITPSMSQRPVSGCSTNIVSISSQSATQSAGGIIQLAVPNQPNTYIKNGSCFLRFQLTVTTVGGATAAGYFCGNNMAQNFSSLILRATMSSGSNVLEQLNNYGQFDAVMSTHTASAGYYQQNMQALYGQKVTIANAAASGSTYNVTCSMPLLFGLLNNPEGQHFPLGLLNTAMQFQFDLAGSGASSLFYTATGITSLTFAVSNVTLNYQAIRVPPEHFQSLRQEMAQSGSLYQMPFVSGLNLSYGLAAADGQTIDQTLGIGLSSCLAFLVSPQVTAANKTQIGVQAGMNQFRLYLDGQLINQASLPSMPSNINSDSEYLAFLNMALGDHLGSVVRTAGPPGFAGSALAIAVDTGIQSSITQAISAAAPSLYASRYFVAGIGTNKFSELGLCYTGTAVSQLQYHLENLNATTAALNTLWIFILFSAALFINAQGDISINR